MTLAREDGVGTGVQLPASKYFKSALILKTNTEAPYSTLDLTQTLSKHFISLLVPQPHSLVL